MAIFFNSVLDVTNRCTTNPAVLDVTNRCTTNPAVLDVINRCTTNPAVLDVTNSCTTNPALKTYLYKQADELKLIYYLVPNTRAFPNQKPTRTNGSSNKTIPTIKDINHTA